MSAPLPPGHTRPASPQPGNRDDRAEICPAGHRHLPPVLDRSCWPAPSAGQDTGQLRDEIARALDEAHPHQSKWREPADAVICSPAVQKLIAERDEARDQVRAVRDLHVPLDRGTGPQCQGCATHITFIPWPCATIRALDTQGRGLRYIEEAL